MVERRKPINKIFDVLNASFLLLVALTCLFPMLHVLFGSLSDPQLLESHRGPLLYPLGFTTIGYKIVLNNPNVWSGYANTIFYVVVGTLLRMIMTMLGGYVLAQKDFMLRRPLMFVFVFTMYFSGGLIPDYLLVDKLGLLNTRWALIVPGLIDTWNMIILKVAFSQIPASMVESARMDGAGDLTVLFRIILPTSKAAIAVVAMYYAVGEWNSWFSAAIYLPGRRDLYPLQLFLREILISYSSGGNVDAAAASAGIMEGLMENVVRYGTICVATVPILCVYPFIQKYFVKGVMMGSIKE